MEQKFMSGGYFRKGTLILLYDGTAKNVEDIDANDLIMGADSRPIKITGVQKTKKQIFKIQPNDGTVPYFISEEHIMCFKYNTRPRINKGKNSQYVVVIFPDVSVDRETHEFPTSKTKERHVNFSIKKHTEKVALEKAQKEHEILTRKYDLGPPTHEIQLVTYLNQAKSFNHRLVGFRSGVEFSCYITQELNPYLLGVWLGDGDSAGTIITNIDKELIDFLYKIGDEMDMNVKKKKDNKNGEDSIRYSFSGKEKGKGSNVFLNFLRNNEILNNKHIPHNYKVNSRENRLLLLAGLIDTDGYFSNNTRYEITQKNKTLANDIVFLARSLGFWCHIKPAEKGCVYKGEMRKGIYQRITFGGDNLNEIPVLIPRKKAPILEKRKVVDYNHYKITITPEKDEDDCYSFETSSTNRKILMGDFTVTFI